MTSGTEEPRWLSDSEQDHWRAYLRGSRYLEEALDRDLQTHGLQLTEYEILSMLSESEGGRLRMSELADLVVQSRSRLTHTAARLEKRGWVVRQCLSDRRGVSSCSPTRAGTGSTAWPRRTSRSVRRHLLDVMAPDEFAALGVAMGKVRDAASGSTRRSSRKSAPRPSSRKTSTCSATGAATTPRSWPASGATPDPARRRACDNARVTSTHTDLPRTPSRLRPRPHLLERAQAVTPGGVNSPVRAFRAVGGTPRFMASASGPWLTDVDGRRYVDLIGSWGPMILGHAHPSVVDAVQAAATRGFSFGTPGPRTRSRSRRRSSPGPRRSRCAWSTAAPRRR